MIRVVISYKLITKAIHYNERIIQSNNSSILPFQVVYLTNYGVTMAQYIVSGADLSQHISTPGMEACGTSNMKFMVNE